MTQPENARGNAKAGFCSVCAQPFVGEVNKVIRAGGSAAKVQAVYARHDLTVTRHTIYAHRPHSMTPESRVVQLAEQGRKALTIRSSSNTEFLESLRDIGFTKAIDDPDSVSLEHALKATSILENRKDKTSDQINLLVLISTGHRPPIEIIDEEEAEGK